ncbi:hypothetical protein A1O1_06811 [Capronia coronata CBS 617.96]|uniref:Uncharacterized protein n=1 Tax=Capronia coronata CBS 617.96 TaxID=1182541 RepID=W9XRJ7_9EURO|nr:uncharacterized protein A1O1_06811 [Capronia coronata CBS 617.96]EXJ83192.1 hypothetical protein A1O1_06811 [Capronia coronata CBS 617.96]
MADDASYAAFLEKANADPKAGYSNSTSHEESESTSQARTKYDPTSSKSQLEALPASLKSLPDVTYTSDTDAPFEPIALNYAGSALPSVPEFEKCLGAKGKTVRGVEELTPDEFDPRGEYKEIIQRVAQAAKIKDVGVKVFRVEITRTRVEYYVLTVGESMLVGVVVKAVES